MSYSRIQFVGHAIDTGPDRDATPPRYRGLPAPEADIQARVRFMLDTVDRARGQPEIDARPDILKVYMLPEFFFRGALGAYRIDDLQRLFSILQARTAGDAYRHWLFLFGTGVGYGYEGDADPAADLDLHATIVNAALFQPGGCGRAASEAARLTAKEFRSTIDFIAYRDAPVGFADRNVDHDPRMDRASDWSSRLPVGRSEHQRWAFDGNAAFSALGIDWGIEICLDHLQHRLHRAGDRVAVQLIPSAGASIDEDGIARNARWVFNVDGLNAGGFASSDDAHTLLLDVVGQRMLHPTVVGLRAHDAHAQDLFTHGAGDVHIYPPVQL